ncbi:hypothetical protein BXY57_0375 [Thermoflavifilum aggregans]|uniref:Uncharacterized protein n=1 Tax=Thermoflavifilum aggregans TaxID=454188 RepID=A0A2M9CS96_9BACT|nr:hypothetical protein BXY57_0375 [Thermoflavifilum aggregans]
MNNCFLTASKTIRKIRKLQLPLKLEGWKAYAGATVFTGFHKHGILITNQGKSGYQVLYPL